MFWQQIYNNSGQLHQQIQQFIAKDDLDSILKLTNIFQEIKHDYQPLVQFLCQPKKMNAIIEFLFQSEPNEFQKVATEIINNDNTTIISQIVNLLCKEGDGQLNTTILEALQSPERFTVTVAESLCRLVYQITKQSQLHAQLCQYLQGPGRDLFDAYVSRLGSAPIAESLHYLNKINPDDNKQVITEFLLYEMNIIISFYGKVTELEFYAHTNFIIQQLFGEITDKNIFLAIFSPLIQILQSLNIKNLEQDSYYTTLEQQRIHHLCQLIPLCFKQISKFILLSETRQECTNWVEVCVQMTQGCSNLISLQSGFLTLNTLAFIADITTIPQSVEQNIKNKENMLVNRTYKPEEAISYVTEYYKAQPKCPQDQSTLLPFITGFNYIFTDFYPHLMESVSAKIFDENWVRMGEPKETNIWCLMGPNKEVMIGSSIWIVQEIIKMVDWNQLFTLLLQYQQASTFYCYLVQIFQILLECRKYCCQFPVQIIQMFVQFSQQILEHCQRKRLSAAEIFSLQILQSMEKYASQEEQSIIFKFKGLIQQL